MSKMGGAIGPSMSTGYTVPFDPEIMKLAALDLLEEAGVALLLHAFASDVIEPLSVAARARRPWPGRARRSRVASIEHPGERGAVASSPAERRVGGVVFETKSGPLVVEARAIVDCTGDGDIAALAGAPFEMGREGDGLVQPMTLMFRMASFEQADFDAYVNENRREWRGVHGLWALVREATRSGELSLSREDILIFAGLRRGEVSVNSTRVSAVVGVDVLDLTKAEILARRQMREIVAFLRRRVPGFERSYVIQSGGSVGVRETRRIVGEYRLEAADVMQARRFEDVIARCAYPIDIHDPSGTGTRLERLPDGQWYDIPLRCLLPREVDGLVVAGRCISGSHEAHSSYRVMPVSMATGQAAGVCAAMAAIAGGHPREVRASCVQAELMRQGAGLGDLDPARVCRFPSGDCASCRVA